MLDVVEIFRSIQGEGNVIGEPSVFIRLSKCNLRCKWCDTAYALENGKEMTEEDIVKEVWKYSNPNKLVTITGGEPLIQDIVPLIKLLKSQGFRIIVETNGTIQPPYLGWILNVGDDFSVSPKLSNSGQKVSYSNLSWADYLKFVVCKPKSDIKEINNFLKTHFSEFKLKLMFDNGKIILQPNGLDKRPNQLLKRIMNYVRDNNLPYRVLPQLHRQVWGIKRGV